MRITGSTVLQSAFDTLESNKKSNKQVVIITDGDCDPHGGTSNPFHNVTVPGKYQYLHTNNYIVVNVKQTKMNFPYLGMDPKVCYVTGNNPKTLNGLIKSLVMSVRDKVPITPEAVLMNSLDMEQLELPCPVPTYQMILSNDVIHRLYDVIISNMPPKKEMLEDIDLMLRDFEFDGKQYLIDDSTGNVFDSEIYEHIGIYSENKEYIGITFI